MLLGEDSDGIPAFPALQGSPLPVCSDVPLALGLELDAAIGVVDTAAAFVDVEALLAAPSTFTPRDVRAFRINANPLICADCSDATLISKFNIAPFCDVPRNIAAGWGCSAEGIDSGATGLIPKATSAGREATGSCTGIAFIGGIVAGDVVVAIRVAAVEDGVTGDDAVE